jgi:hypothetical protein
MRGIRAGPESLSVPRKSGENDRVSERMMRELCQVDGVIEGESAFKDGPALWVNGKEIAHFEDEHAIDLRLTRAEIRARRAELRADPRVSLRAASSDWITVEFADPGDEALVRELTEIAAAAHRPIDGGPGRLPPAGADLARRKHFH